jgi:hypothetical protein
VLNTDIAGLKNTRDVVQDDIGVVVFHPSMELEGVVDRPDVNLPD